MTRSEFQKARRAYREACFLEDLVERFIDGGEMRALHSTRVSDHLRNGRVIPAAPAGYSDAALLPDPLVSLRQKREELAAASARYAQLLRTLNDARVLSDEHRDAARAVHTAHNVLCNALLSYRVARGLIRSALPPFSPSLPSALQEAA